MTTEHSWATARIGARAARWALVGTGAIFIMLVVGWCVVAVQQAVAGGHGGRGIAIAAVALIFLGVSVRVLSLNLRATRTEPDAPTLRSEAADQSGVWGVGGPSMREPGTTGAWPIRGVDRRYQNRD